jgi:hypothetical protein
MTTRIMGGTVQAANGSLLNSIPIEIELVLADAFVVTGSYSMGGKLTLQTGPDGRWSTPLQCNNDLTPVGTLYQVTEKIPGFYGGAKCYLIQVTTGLPTAPAVNEVLNSIVPQAVPVGGTYSPVGSGPQGIQGPQGVAGYVTVADNTALAALTPKIEGLPVYVTSTECLWIWDSTSYRLANFPRFISQASGDTALLGVTGISGGSYYRATNSIEEGPYYRNSNGVYSLPWNMPWGNISTVFGAQASISFGTTPVVVMSFTPVLRSRRRYLFTASLRAFTSASNSSTRATLGGTTPPTPIPNTTLVVDHYFVGTGGVSGMLGSIWVQVPFTVTTQAAYTIGFAINCGAGTGLYWTDSGGFISIDDTGPSGAPI